MKTLLPALILFIFQASFAAEQRSLTLTNNLKGVGISNTPDYQSVIICVDKIDGNQMNPDYAIKYGDSYPLSYSSWIGLAFRLNGCDATSDPYLGYYKLQNPPTTLQPSTTNNQLLVQFNNLAINNAGVISGSLQYSKIPTNTQLPNPSTPKTWKYVGFNLSGLEFSEWLDPTVVPNLSSTCSTPASCDIQDTSAFINAGMNTVRVPVRWGYLQPGGTPGEAAIDLNYFSNFVTPVLESLTKAGIYTIVDLHAYMRYVQPGTGCAGFCPGQTGSEPNGTPISSATPLVGVWSNLYTAISSDKNIDMNYIIFDLMNEPVTVTAQQAFDYQSAVIKALSQKGYNGIFLIEGTGWTGLHAWSLPNPDNTPNNAEVFTAKNISGIGYDPSKIIINVHQYLDSNFSGTQNICNADLTSTGVNGYNLQAFTDWLKEQKLTAIVTEFGAGIANGPSGQMDPSCKAALNAFMQYLQSNAVSENNPYGFIGWTIWSTGHGWGNYNLRVTPTSDQMTILQNYLSGKTPPPQKNQINITFNVTAAQSGQDGCTLQVHNSDWSQKQNLAQGVTQNTTVNYKAYSGTNTFVTYCAFNNFQPSTVSKTVNIGNNTVSFCDMYPSGPGC